MTAPAHIGGAECEGAGGERAGRWRRLAYGMEQERRGGE
jgi:hypothetical protein